MELPVMSAGKVASKVTVSEQTFDRPLNEGLVHQVVTSYLATGRAGTATQKNRSDVRGGGTKPWRQKGTGRARAGWRQSPPLVRRSRWREDRCWTALVPVSARR